MQNASEILTTCKRDKNVSKKCDLWFSFNLDLKLENIFFLNQITAYSLRLASLATVWILLKQHHNLCLRLYSNFFTYNFFTYKLLYMVNSHSFIWQNQRGIREVKPVVIIVAEVITIGDLTVGGDIEEDNSKEILQEVVILATKVLHLLSCVLSYV